MDTHLPYTPKPEFDKWGGDEIAEIQSSIEDVPSKEFIGGRPWWHLEALEHLYDGTILEADHYVEMLIRGLQQSGEHKDTLVVITSDHGEGFGEVSRVTNSTRMVDHSWGIHEVLTHVPLIVKYPGQSNPAEIEEPATLTEFPATVREAIHGESNEGSFVPEGPVISSTYRLKTDDEGLFSWNQGHPDDYVGPWRAVYEETDDLVRKYIQKDENSVIVEVYDAQHSCLISRDDGGTVESTFKAIQPQDIGQSQMESPSDDVEDRLNQLGYLT